MASHAHLRVPDVVPDPVLSLTGPRPQMRQRAADLDSLGSDEQVRRLGRPTGDDERTRHRPASAPDPSSRPTRTSPAPRIAVSVRRPRTSTSPDSASPQADPARTRGRSRGRADRCPGAAAGADGRQRLPAPPRKRRWILRRLLHLADRARTEVDPDRLAEHAWCLLSGQREHLSSPLRPAAHPHPPPKSRIDVDDAVVLERGVQLDELAVQGRDSHEAPVDAQRSQDLSKRRAGVDDDVSSVEPYVPAAREDRRA